MSLLDDLYQTVVLEHSRHPRHASAPAAYDVARRGDNPSCGDELTLYLGLVDGRLATVGYEASGCAISVASASLMSEAVAGLDVSTALAVVDDFRQMIRGEEPTARLGDAACMRGVSRLHARVKCATLPWLTLEAALAERLGEAAGDQGPSVR